MLWVMLHGHACTPRYISRLPSRKNKDTKFHSKVSHETVDNWYWNVTEMEEMLAHQRVVHRSVCQSSTLVMQPIWPINQEEICDILSRQKAIFSQIIPESKFDISVEAKFATVARKANLPDQPWSQSCHTEQEAALRQMKVKEVKFGTFGQEAKIAADTGFSRYCYSPTSVLSHIYLTHIPV